MLQDNQGSLLDRLFGAIWSAVREVAPGAMGVVIAGSAARRELEGAEGDGKLLSRSDVEFVIVHDKPLFFHRNRLQPLLDSIENQYFSERQLGRFNYWVVRPARFFSDRALFFVEARGNGVRLGRPKFLAATVEPGIPRTTDLAEILLHRLVHAYTALPQGLIRNEQWGTVRSHNLTAAVTAIGRDLLDLLTVYGHLRGVKAFSYRERLAYFENADNRKDHPFVTEALLLEISAVLRQRGGGCGGATPDAAVQRLAMLLEGADQLLRLIAVERYGYARDAWHLVNMNDAGWKTIVHRVIGLFSERAFRIWRALFISKQRLYLALNYRLRSTLASGEDRYWLGMALSELRRVMPNSTLHDLDSTLRLWIRVLYPYVRRSRLAADPVTT